jgi:lipoprotein signal peptidase
MRSALTCGVAFAVALSLDLLTKVYAVAYLSGPHGLVYNNRPHDLAIRLDVSALTIAAVFLIEHFGRRRGLGRLWGAWICIGVLIAGTLGNGVSSYIWARGVPDFIRLPDGWMWNIADFEIVAGLVGAALSIVANALIAFGRARWALARASAARTD